MNLRKLFSSTALSALLLFAALPARAGIPLLDATLLAQQVLRAVAWIAACPAKSTQEQ